MALELRPSCEQCTKSLPPDATDAMICSFECTFCRDCVERVLLNVCPNCGGGFTPRPIRPKRAWKDGLNTTTRPPIATVTHSPVEPAAHAKFAAAIRDITPEER